MPHKFLLFGTGIGGNYGCDAIVIGSAFILRNSFPNSEIWFYSNSSRKVNYDKIVGPSSGIMFKGNDFSNRIVHLGRRIFEKTGISNRSLFAYSPKLTKQADCILSIGGDLYTFAENEENWPFPYPIVEAGNEIIRTGKPYVIWCASVGPLEKAGDRLGEIIQHLRSCRAIIVRETASFSYLRNTIGLRDNVYLAADPAFLMETEPFEYPFLKKMGDTKLLAVNFSLGPMQHIYGHLPVTEFQNKLSGILKELLENLPIKILLVPNVGSDVPFMTPIHESLANYSENRIQMLPVAIGARKTKWAVSKANALLTMRFHCALAGFSTNTPTMVLVSTSKGDKICREMYGDSDYAVNIRDMNVSNLIPPIAYLLKNEDSIRSRLTQVSEEMKRRALSAGDVLKNIL